MLSNSLGLALSLSLFKLGFQICDRGFKLSGQALGASLGLGVGAAPLVTLSLTDSFLDGAHTALNAAHSVTRHVTYRLPAVLDRTQSALSGLDVLNRQ